MQRGHQAVARPRRIIDSAAPLRIARQRVLRRRTRVHVCARSCGDRHATDPHL